ncbi:UNVERIFIED_CONTAM: hypothetical protein K2H54_054308 [Gekko kuhli]
MTGSLPPWETPEEEGALTPRGMMTSPLDGRKQPPLGHVVLTFKCQVSGCFPFRAMAQGHGDHIQKLGHPTEDHVTKTTVPPSLPPSLPPSFGWPLPPDQSGPVAEVRREGRLCLAGLGVVCVWGGGGCRALLGPAESSSGLPEGPPQI